jgi:hypothetical protein
MVMPNIFKVAEFIRQTREDTNLDVFEKVRKVRNFLDIEEENYKEEKKEEKKKNA